MCGLVGFIGSPIDKTKSKKLITELFDKTKVRGIDASGYYCVDNNKQIYHKKQPGISTNLINTQCYEEMWKSDLNMGLFHCRAASIGIGLPSDNKNNHPFVNKDNKKAIIHNGLISIEEYSLLKKFFDVESNCDSEIILRVLERSDKDIIENIELLLSFTKNSMFSWAFAETKEESDCIILTRNKHRPLFLADLREELGQIIFFSTMEIYLSSVNALKKSGFIIEKQPIFLEVLPYDVISMKNDITNKFDIKIHKCKKTNLDAFSLFANDNKMFNKNKVSQMCNKFKEVSNLLSIHLDSNEYSNLKVDEIIENMDDIIIRMNELKDNII